jgi:tetratricopeptide (TPR) repeat protein
LEEAVVAYRKAIALKPNSADSYHNLSRALIAQGKLAEATEASQKAIAVNPREALAHNGLAVALEAQGKSAEAEEACRKAIALKPDFAGAHINLGIALTKQGKRAEAVDAYRKGIALKPDLAGAHYNLGCTLESMGMLTEAADAYHKAISLKPDYAEAYCNLGRALEASGRFTEALTARRKGHALGSKQRDWRFPSEKWIKECERLVELEKRLPAVLQGESRPANASERAEFAKVCNYKRQYLAASRLYNEALVEDPELAANPKTGTRYDAACMAALAGCGQGEDAGDLSEVVRTQLRQQALNWLRAELEAWDQLLLRDATKIRSIASQKMQGMQADRDFTGVRDQEGLARLPEAERREWQKLWEEVAALRQRAAGPQEPATPRCS